LAIKSRLSKFCYWQTLTKDDVDEEGNQVSFTCAAHLAEGRARECTYKDYKDSQERRYPCVDANYKRDKI